MGLKPFDLITFVREIYPFQTDPCGVEAADPLPSENPLTRFRRTLVGLKLVGSCRYGLGKDGFRRTLVGLKHRYRHGRI